MRLFFNIRIGLLDTRFGLYLEFDYVLSPLLIDLSRN